MHAPTPTFSLAGKIALVTGAGSGIGAAIAQRFARQGAHVVLADLRLETAEEVAAGLRTAGLAAEARAVDVSDALAAEDLARAHLAAHGHLDVLVNSAGVGCVGTVVQSTADDLDRLHAVNVRGVWNLCRAFLPSMIARRQGSIISLASVGGLVGIRDRAAYCATKFAVVGLTKSMALDHARDGVRINCLCPGRVETPFVSARLAEYPDPAAARREMEQSQPVGRMARPEEIAAAALYLASDESRFVTGCALAIDGGWSAG
jgi:2-keto-3-deoxy-L-fuconate dehydrogenase